MLRVTGGYSSYLCIRNFLRIWHVLFNVKTDWKTPNTVRKVYGLVLWYFYGLFFSLKPAHIENGNQYFCVSQKKENQRGLEHHEGE